MRPKRLKFDSNGSGVNDGSGGRVEAIKVMKWLLIQGREISLSKNVFITCLLTEAGASS